MSRSSSPDRHRAGPLKVMFINTSLPVGGAEVLLAHLVRGFDRQRVVPELCCLKEPGPLGQQLAAEVPLFANLLRSKWDIHVLGRLSRLLVQRGVDAVVTIGAGDKMFWGRLAAARAGVPVVLSALHSTGYPDVIQRSNRWLNRITDAYIAVAPAHGRYLAETEGLPAEKIRVIPNGVDTNRFRPDVDCSRQREELRIASGCPVVGIVAALRPEKDHRLFLAAAAGVRRRVPGARFLVVGDGPLRGELMRHAETLGIADAVHFLGNRQDIPQLLGLMDLFVLTSRMEASPVSILEAMATGKPVVAPDVGSIADSVIDGATGFLVRRGDESQIEQRLVRLLTDAGLRSRLGAAGRRRVEKHGSLERMIKGYEQLISDIYASKRPFRQASDIPASTLDSTFILATDRKTDEMRNNPVADSRTTARHVIPLPTDLTSALLDTDHLSRENATHQG